MAKVLLVQPNDNIRNGKKKADPCTPLSMVLIGTAIENKHSVRIYDRNLDVSDLNFINYLQKYDPDIIGFTAMTSLMLLDIIHLGKLIKKIYPEKIIVVGGIHATLEPNSFLNEPYIDYIIRGEGEDAFLEFCDTFDKNPKKLGKLKNINLNSLRPYIKMDSLNLPNYNLLDLKKYEHFYVSVSRGCPGNCTFCETANLWGINGRPFVRAFNTKKTMELFKEIIEKYKRNTFEIIDDNFLTFKSRCFEVCDYLSKHKVYFHCFSRVDYIDDEILKKLKKAGCHTIQIGAESGSQRILDFLNKRVTVQQNINAILCCRRNNITCDASFMIGLPTETLEEMRETINLIEKYKPDIANVKIYNPLPGSNLFDLCVKNSLIKKPTSLEEWAIWTGNHRTVNHNVSTRSTEDLIKISQRLWRTSYYKTRIKKFIFWTKAGNFSNVFHGVRKFVSSGGKLYVSQ
ncbi:MAG: radical SAM protein [Nanoarchaeota archaeon]